MLFACSPTREAGYSDLLIEKEIKSKEVDNLPVKFQRFRESATQCKIFYQIDPKDFLAMRDSSGNWIREMALELKIKGNQFGSSTLLEIKRDSSLASDVMIRDSFCFELPARKDVWVECNVFDENKHVYQTYSTYWERDMDFIPEDFYVEEGSFVEYGRAQIRKNKTLEGELNLEVYQNIFFPAERLYNKSISSLNELFKPELKFTGTFTDITHLINGLNVESYCLIYPNNSSEEKKKHKFHFTLQEKSSAYSIAPLTYLLDKDSGKNEIVSVNDWTQFWSRASGNDPKKAGRLMKEFNRRVKYANDNFGSYKSGWQTDRGMMYIVMGKPDRIQNDIRGEIWIYGFAEVNSKQFTFEKSPFGINKEDYVLSRELFYREIWQSALLKWENGWVTTDDF
jgi:GWxTD domain-containing protein